jgi:hypothetical protein
VIPGPGTASPAPLLRPGRRGAILAGLLVATVGIIARAAQLQLLEHEQWSQVARRQHVREREVRPARGAIEDAAGGVLAQSRDLVRLSIDPRVLRPGRGRPRGADDTVPDYRTRVRVGLGALGVPEAVVRRAMDTLQRPLQLPAHFLPSDVERFVGIPRGRGPRGLSWNSTRCCAARRGWTRWCWPGTTAWSPRRSSAAPWLGRG